MIITPSIYEKTPSGLLNRLDKLSPYFSRFQIDISDGVFAPNKTVNVDQALSTIYDLGSMINNLTFDFHLMVQDYEPEIKKLINFQNKINVNSILIHYSLFPLKSYLLNLKSSFGLVLNPEDQVEDLIKNYDLKKIPEIQIMTIQIGAQGNPFLSENLKKIEQLKINGFQGKILLDGGINDQTLPLILAQKERPDVLCPGSYLVQVQGEELVKRVNFLKSNLSFEASG